MEIESNDSDTLLEERSREGVLAIDPPQDSIAAVSEFFFEIGYLKRLPRAGWILAGSDTAETVGTHVFRTALIGFVLALMEGVDPWRTAVMCLVHDIPETRIGDLHAISKRYIGQDDAERKAIDEVLRSLPDDISGPLSDLFADFRSGGPESMVAREADILECLYQAHEYFASGFVGAKHLIPSLTSRLKLDCSKKLSKSAGIADPNQWWLSLAQKKDSAHE